MKATLKPTPGGRKGKLALDWWVSETTPAQLVMLADLSTRKVWLFTREELFSIDWQKSERGFHICTYTDPSAQPRKPNRLPRADEFDEYLLEKRFHEIFEH